MKPSPLLLFTLAVFFAFSLAARQDAGDKAGPPSANSAPADSILADSILADSAPADRAAALAAALDDASLAAQVIMSGVDGKSLLGQDMRRLLGDCPPGALMLFRYNLNAPPEEARRFIAQCVEAAEAAGALPPFVAADHEGGQVHRFGPGIGRLPAAASWEERARQEGRAAALGALETAAYESGREIRALGLNLNLAPVAEILNDDNRAFLDDRSFGGDADFVTAAAAAYIRGMERAGIGCVVKHFPGNSGVDPHKNTAVLSGSREELARAVQPFARLIQGVSGAPPGASGAPSGAPPVTGIMVSHVLVPAWDAERIGSFSPVLINQWLRGDLRFEGLVLADDFSMAAASTLVTPEEAAVLSLAAGADMVMAWPQNLRQVHRAILAALEKGTLSRARLEEAASRIIAEKIRLGLLRP
ncbi:MAG: glycoside hydrolase family 3 protein [Treponema sp.]|jgi:beta-N-acetylhexosaminidase|nr:glycoside hydrolase family 3 protein [Treponema sp.]